MTAFIYLMIGVAYCAWQLAPMIVEGEDEHWGEHDISQGEGRVMFMISMMLVVTAWLAFVMHDLVKMWLDYKSK